MVQHEHLARHVAVDLFLDTLQYGAHTTASDALFMGVPVITLPGDHFAARVASGLLRSLRSDGLPGPASPTTATSLRDYEDLAVTLATRVGPTSTVAHASPRLNALRSSVLGAVCSASVAGGAGPDVVPACARLSARQAEVVLAADGMGHAPAAARSGPPRLFDVRSYARSLGSMLRSTWESSVATRAPGPPSVSSPSDEHGRAGGSSDEAARVSSRAPDAASTDSGSVRFSSLDVSASSSAAAEARDAVARAAAAQKSAARDARARAMEAAGMDAPDEADYDVLDDDGGMAMRAQHLGGNSLRRYKPWHVVLCPARS